jgi:hypothetical protein
MAKKDNTIVNTVSRRQFGAVAGVAAVAAGTPAVAMASNSPKISEVTETVVSLPTAKGPVNGFFARPAKGKFPGVLAWRGEAGLGVDNRKNARLLARQGYSVLVLDRDGADAPSIETDAQDAVAWLEKNAAVDETRGIGTPEWAEQRMAPARRY